MEENFVRDKRKGKAKVEDTDQDSLPPQSNSDKGDGYYYVKLCGPLKTKDAVGPDALEGVTRNLYRVRNKDIARLLRNEDERLQKIHSLSGATVGISSDPLSRAHRHSYLDLIGTVDQVAIAEMLVEDAIAEMYKLPYVPKAFMPIDVCHRGMSVPLLKVGYLLGVYGDNLAKMEKQSGAWIELETIEQSSAVQSWEKGVNIYGSFQQITIAMELIARYVSEEPTIPEYMLDTVPPEDDWDSWDIGFNGIIPADEGEHQESGNFEGETEQHAFAEETVNNDSAKEAAAATEDNGSAQTGNGKDHVEETVNNDSVKEAAAATEDSWSAHSGNGKDRVEETVNNESVKEPVAIEDSGSAQLGNRKDRVEEN